MSKMFIANLTRQVQDFHYRLPENPAVRRQQIPMGGQIQISGDLSTPDVEAIIEQHSIYGLVNVSEIDRTRDFAGICYSLDKPVNVSQIQRGISHNVEVLVERGKEIRREAAVAVNNAVEEQTGADLKALELEVVEQEGKDGKDQEVNEKVRVDRTAPPPSRGAVRRQPAQTRAG